MWEGFGSQGKLVRAESGRARTEELGEGLLMTSTPRLTKALVDTSRGHCHTRAPKWGI